MLKVREDDSYVAESFNDAAALPEQVESINPMNVLRTS